VLVPTFSREAVYLKSEHRALPCPTERPAINLGVREANSPVLASGCFHYASNKWGKNEVGSDTKLHKINNMATDDTSPEKAGVGGSTPSLATIFSITYKPSISQTCSILFQYLNGHAGVCLNSKTVASRFSIHEYRIFGRRFRPLRPSAFLFRLARAPTSLS